MPTPREMIAFLGAEATVVVGDPAVLDAPLGRPAPLGDAAEGAFSFCGSTAREPLEALARTRATLVVIDSGLLERARGQEMPRVPVLVPSGAARLDFIRLVDRFYAPPAPAGIHPSAVVHPAARVHETAAVGPLCTVGEDAEIGAGSMLHAGVHVYRGVRIGQRVTVHAGTVIGADGYGYERDEAGRLVRFPHVGSVLIEDDVEIGANACIDRGTLGDTAIRTGARVDNLVHIAHNVEVGRNAAVIALAMVGGGTRIGSEAWVAPGAVLRDRIAVGDGAVVGLGAVVTRDVPAGATVLGNPARGQEETRALQQALRRLTQG